MQKQFKQYLQSVLFIFDLFTLSVTFILSYLLYQKSIDIYQGNYYLIFWVFVNVLWIIISFLNGNYFEKTIIHFEDYTKKSIQVFIIWVVCILFVLLLLEKIYLSKYFVMTYFLLMGIGIMLNRFIYLGIRNFYKHTDHLFKNVLILGYNDTALKLASYFEEESININLKGFIEDKMNVNELTPYPIFSERKNVLKIANELNVEEIYTTLNPDQNDFITWLIDHADKNCIRIKIVPNLSYFFSKPVVVDYLRDLPILSPRNEPLEDVGNRVKKRFLDLIISTLVIIFILSWMIPIIGLLIIIESRGPVFFIQRRTGKNNHPFNCLKFRSMHVNHYADRVQAKKNDSRITKIGKILRQTSLDEFPQFINVFRGEMSLVGPRPHMIKHTDEYSQIVDRFMLRHFSKPGITGWAQINGYRGEITDPKQIRLRVSNDIWYLENWNVWLDIKIIFLTIYKVFKGDKNAY